MSRGKDQKEFLVAMVGLDRMKQITMSITAVTGIRKTIMFKFDNGQWSEARFYGGMEYSRHFEKCEKEYVMNQIVEGFITPNTNMFWTIIDDPNEKYNNDERIDLILRKVDHMEHWLNQSIRSAEKLVNMIIKSAR